MLDQIIVYAFRSASPGSDAPHIYHKVIEWPRHWRATVENLYICLKEINDIHVCLSPHAFHIFGSSQQFKAICYFFSPHHIVYAQVPLSIIEKMRCDPRDEQVDLMAVNQSEPIRFQAQQSNEEHSPLCSDWVTRQSIEIQCCYWIYEFNLQLD